MKKLFAVLLSIVLVLSMGTVALAADAGSITITNAVDGAEYNVYKFLMFTPANEDGDKGVYRIEWGWEEFFETAPATDYFEREETGFGPVMKLKEGVTAVDQTLAKAAIKFAEDNGIAPVATMTAEGNTVEFTGLEFGYYAIDTSLGTLCALTNTNSDFTAAEKNEKPDIDKFVQEDSEMNNADEGWGKVNDADINQVVNYKSTVTVGLGATNYVMHDTMEEGLTFKAGSVVVKLADGTVVDATNYEVVVSPADGHTFDVKFNNDFIAGLDKGTQFTVYYSATLNENAKIVDDGNDNTVYLSYGEDSTWETSKHKTTTYTWKAEFFKYAMDGENKVPLQGAEFYLTYASGENLQFSQVEGTDVPTYVVDPDGSVTSITTDEKGRFIIIGLDEGAYELGEAVPPAGYNLLGKPVDVVITSTYDEANLTATYEINDAEPATIEVENKTGGLFPETGGIGTTIFYVVGILLMLAAVVVLVSKKRMASFA